MTLDVEDLIRHPFLELVQRGQEAIANAEGADEDGSDAAKQMLKSARAIVREGERALQRVTPLLNAQMERHGDAFAEALRECGK
jgi:hypothetical protein